MATLYVNAKLEHSVDFAILPVFTGLERVRSPTIWTVSTATGERIMTDIPENKRTELEAAAFRRLVEHLRERTDVQNIDLMNLAGFCRNCLSNWYRDAAEADGLELSKDESREIIYGMPYSEWRDRYQTEATPEKKARFAETAPRHD